MASTILADNGVSSGSAGIKTSADSSGVLVLQTSTSGGTATNAVYIDTAQNVGLGVTPSAWGTYKAFQLNSAGYSMMGGTSGAIFGALGVNYYYDGSGYKYINSSYATQYNQSAGAHTWSTAGIGTAGNAITFTQAMTLDASGNLGVGVTSPATKLDVNGVINVRTNGYQFGRITTNNVSADTGGLAFQYSSAGSFVEGFRLDGGGNLLVGTTSANFTGSGFTLSSNSGTTKWLCGPYSSGATAFYVTGQSGFGVYLTSTTATSWSSNSDERLKTDLKPIENAAQKVCSLRAVTGRYKIDEEGVSRSFLIAQDVQAVLPEAVSSSKQAGSEDETEYLSVAYTDTIPLLVAAIKELKADLDATKAELAALKGN